MPAGEGSLLTKHIPPPPVKLALHHCTATTNMTLLLKMRADVNVQLALSILAISAVHLLVLKSVIQQTKKEEKAPSRESHPVTKIFRDRSTVSKELCAFVAHLAKESIEARGVFHLAVAGGSLLDSLAGLVAHKDTVDFSKVVLSFANHKCVEPDSDKATLLKSKMKFSTEAGINVFITPSPNPKEDGDGSNEAAFYSKALKDAGIPHAKGFPVFDLILLGLGADGHVGSCHPKSPAVADCTHSVTASPKQGDTASITLTIESMNSARHLVVVVCGGNNGKKEAVQRAMKRPAESPRGTFPAQLLHSPIFFLDYHAAEGL